MPLTEDLKNQFLARLKERGSNVNCRNCEKNQWLIADNLVGLYAIHPEHVLPPHAGAAPTTVTAIPTFCLICGNCGYVELFAGGVLGLTPWLPPREGEKPVEPVKPVKEDK